MANEEHIQVLRQGPLFWGRWREKNSELQPDLSGADLRNADLSEANLQRANLGGSDLGCAILERADLRGADLGEANLEETNLIEADLGNARLSGANLDHADFREANLRGADLERAVLRFADFRESNLKEANLNETDLSWAKLNGANLEGAELRGARFNSSSAQTANLTIGQLASAILPTQALIDRGLSFETGTAAETIIREIEFPAEYHQAGLSILEYFGTVVRQKYPDTAVKVRIEQEGLKVRMVIETPEGKKEPIEKTLTEYGLVVVGEKKPAEFLTDKFHVT